MNAIRLPYFGYPKTQENQADFREWECPICLSDDPAVLGGTVAHGAYDAVNVHIEGRKHPVHRDCLLSLLERSSNCPSCRAVMDASPIIPFMTKCRLGALRIYHSLPTLYERSRDWTLNPMNQFYVGFTCMVVGILARKNLPVSIGMGLQASGMHQAVQYGRHQIAIAQQIENLAKDLISDLHKHSSIRLKLEQLKSIAAVHPPYYTQIFSWIDSHDKGEVLRGLTNAAEFAEAAIWADRIIRFWRTSMTVGALYFGGKFIWRLEKNGEAMIGLPDRTDCEMKWLFYELLMACFGY